MTPRLSLVMVAVLLLLPAIPVKADQVCFDPAMYQNLPDTSTYAVDFSTKQTKGILSKKGIAAQTNADTNRRNWYQAVDALMDSEGREQALKIALDEARRKPEHYIITSSTNGMDIILAPVGTVTR